LAGEVYELKVGWTCNSAELTEFVWENPWIAPLRRPKVTW